MNADAEPLSAQRLRQVIEGALLVSGRPLRLADLAKLFAGGDAEPEEAALRAALAELAERCDGRAVELVELAGGFRYQLRVELSPWLRRLWQEPPPRYSRALFETLALIAYRQPLSRGGIEQVRGVSVSPGIIRTLEEREWIRVVGTRDAPGRAALYGTTQRFLQDFSLSGLEALPALLSTEEAAAALADSGSAPLDAASAPDAGAPAREPGDAGESLTWRPALTPVAAESAAPPDSADSDGD